MDKPVQEAGKASIVRNNVQTAISLHERQQSQRLRVVDLLTVLAEARQGPVSAQTYELFSSELSHHDLRDVEKAMRKLMRTRRDQGEKAFPDLPTLEDAIVDEKNDRLKVERLERERLQNEAEERDRREHPENWVDAGPNCANLLAGFFKERAQQPKEPKPPLPQKGICPHCHGVQLSDLRPEDLRALADVVQKREALNSTRAGSTHRARASGEMAMDVNERPRNDEARVAPAIPKQPLTRTEIYKSE